MLVIRLQRVGKKKQASFRVVLQEKTWKTQGKIKELLGFYNPHSKEKKFQTERVQYWLSKGAQPSVTIHNFFVDAGIVEGPKIKAWKPKKKKKVEGEAKPAAEIKPEKTSKEPAEKPSKIGESVETKKEPDPQPEEPPKETETQEKPWLRSPHRLR